MEKLAVLRYTKALFDLAVEKNAVQQYNQAAASILNLLESDKDVVGIINHPSIPLDKKMDALTIALAGTVPADFMGIFALMLRRGRKDDILGVLRHFDVLYKEYSRLAVAKLYSSEELPQEKVNEITQILSKKLDKTIEVEKVIDKSLIAGFRVEVDGFVFDASIKNQMNLMKKQLLGSFY